MNKADFFKVLEKAKEDEFYWVIRSLQDSKFWIDADHILKFRKRLLRALEGGMPPVPSRVADATQHRADARNKIKEGREK